MSDIISADALIQEGVDEFKMAAAKTATGIIEQGLAVLKIKQGCEKKQGGTDFPDVAMRELNLKEATARAYARVGEHAVKLRTIVRNLPSESLTTIEAVARMDEATIADKVERGVITPTATRAQVLEKKRVSKEVTVAADDPNAPDLSAVEVYATLPSKHQKALEAHIQGLMTAYKKKVRKELVEEADALAQEKAALIQARSTLDNQIKYAKRPFTREEYQLIRGMLHPDKHPDFVERANRAIAVFAKIEKLCKVSKTPLKGVKSA